MKLAILTLAMCLCLLPLLAQEDYAVRMDKKDAFTVVGMEVLNTTDSAVMMELWTRFIPAVSQVPNLVGEQYYGLNYYTEELNAEGEPGFGYMAAAEVRELREVPEGFVSRVIPASAYAVFTHRGSAEGLSKVFEYIYGTWVRETNLKPKMQPSFEVYGSRYNPESPDSIVEVWVPVQE